jgi:hypothetical protein
MKRLTGVLFAAILTFAFFVAPSILVAEGGHAGHGGGGGYHRGHYGGYHGGYHGGYYGGYHGRYRYPGGPFFGFSAGFWTGYYPWYYPWFYPGYYPGYYYAPPVVYDPSSVAAAPPPTYIAPPSVTQDPGPEGVLPPPSVTGQIPPSSNQRRCQIWAPTGEFHNESRWNSQKQTMETVSVPDFAWQDYPCK